MMQTESDEDEASVRGWWLVEKCLRHKVVDFFPAHDFYLVTRPYSQALSLTEGPI
jgi:hypothetical protein